MIPNNYVINSYRTNVNIAVYATGTKFNLNQDKIKTQEAFVNFNTNCIRHFNKKDIKNIKFVSINAATLIYLYLIYPHMPMAQNPINTIESNLRIWET